MEMEPLFSLGLPPLPLSLSASSKGISADDVGDGGGEEDIKHGHQFTFGKANGGKHCLSNCAAPENQFLHLFKGPYEALLRQLEYGSCEPMIVQYTARFKHSFKANMLKGPSLSAITSVWLAGDIAFTVRTPICITPFHRLNVFFFSGSFCIIRK